MNKKLRILQIHHALYIPYLLTKGFRELGHKADSLYFDVNNKSIDLTWGYDYNFKSHPFHTFQISAFFLYALTQYDVFHFWGQPYFIPATFELFKEHFPIDLVLLKKFRKKIVFSSDGCFRMIRPSVWKKEIDPEICLICQTSQGDTYGFCSNYNTIHLNRAMEKYCDLRFGIGLGVDYEKNAKYCFYPVDMELWNPSISIPKEYIFQRKRTDSILLYHGVGSHVIGNRGNIKGTNWLTETVEQLQTEGYNVELMHVEGCPNKIVRFYQAQADIVIDQLLVGGGGQTSRECLALGKPVLTRMHPQQIITFAEAVLPYEPVPLIPTEHNNLKENLIKLIENPQLRLEIGKKSYAFAKNVLAPPKSAANYIGHYQKLF